MTLFGDPYLSCDISIKSSHTIKTLISPIFSSNTATGTEYIYLERLRPVGVCSHRYMALKHPLQSCYYWHGAIHLHFRGNVNISIHEGETVGRDGSIGCLEYINQEDNESQTSGCEIQEYESVSQCGKKLKIMSNINRLEAGPTTTLATVCDMQCPDNCSCILNDREVMYSCSIENEPPKNRRVFLLFPSNISILDMSENGLTAIKSDSFSTIGKFIIALNLCSNSLESLPAGIFHGLPNLLYLDLHDNSLMSLPAGSFHGLLKLNCLYLNDNSFVSLQAELFHDLHKLYMLRLGYNFLASLPARLFLTLHNLHILTITSNRITHVAPNTFSNLTSLKLFYFASNQLTFLSLNLFDDLVNLRLLDLSNNKLTHIPRLGHMTKLSVINLVGNKLTGITQEMFDGVAEDCTITVDQPVVCVCYMNKSESCFNTGMQSPYLTCGWLLSLTVLSIFTWILGLCATLGNGFVLLWRQLSQRGHEKTVQSVLLCNLAMSDLLMGIYMVIIATADVYYGEYFPMNAKEWRSGFTCRMASTLAIISSEASVFFVTLISVDRFINIKFPYTIHKLRIKSTWWIHLWYGVFP